ncbi:type IV secretion system protein [Paraburkholderia susongensis]|uniref:Type IV secretion system protein VirB5 n=1 Tax=Paraburkholderia susongensis TaxID=1515439 RepID=A0A1X7M5U1_9BURK|nr:type IV secretion system protein [Paraburkholderia susongensis]SMG61566.1 type IV secretion system protein VirB5 [Paraburkholderia susongensis]
MKTKQTVIHARENRLLAELRAAWTRRCVVWGPTRSGKSAGVVLPFLRSHGSTLRRSVIAIASTLCFSMAHATGIPVLDVSNLAQALLMVENLQTQVQQMKDQYAAVIGNRGLGQILNDPSLRTYLPDQWQSIYDQAKSGQLPGITSAMQQIANQEGLNGAYTPGQQRYNDTLASNKAMAMQAYAATAARLDNIKNLMAQSNLTQDPAAKADLQNRWAAEYTMVQNEQTRLNLMSKLQDTELQLADEQRHREFKNRLLGVSQ